MEVGPPLARFYPGLPPLRDLSPREIAAYVKWRYEDLTARPGDDDEDDGEG